MAGINEKHPTSSSFPYWSRVCVCDAVHIFLQRGENDSEWWVGAGARVIHEQWGSVSVLTGRAGVWLIPTSSGQLLWSSSLYVFPTIHLLSCWVGNLQKEECESAQLVAVSLRQERRHWWFPHNSGFTTWVCDGSEQGTTPKAVHSVIVLSRTLWGLLYKNESSGSVFCEPQEPLLFTQLHIICVAWFRIPINSLINVAL